MPQRTSRHLPLWIATGAMALLLAACSGGAATTAPTAAAVPTVPAVAVPTVPAAAALVSKATTSKGDALVAPNGHTLYTFDHDTTPGASACTAAGCMGVWPPLPGAGTPTAGAGVTGTLATFTRSDSIVQVTYNGKPLYFYAPDVNAGDTTGDGVGGVWHIAKP